jgi:aspartokinase
LGQDLSKIKVGGLKILEEGAGVVSSLPEGAQHLMRGICSPLAQNKINLTYLTHVAGAFGAEDYTVFCTELAAGMTSFTQVKSYSTSSGHVSLHAPTCIISLYPHDKRSDIKGAFIRALARARVMVLSLASSPSAISAVVSTQAKERAVERLFSFFQFPSYTTPAEFYAIQPPPEALVREVVAAYQEKVIKIYQLIQQADLDLWSVSIPTSMVLDNLGSALMALGEQGLKIPFLVALPGPEDRFVCTFSTASERGEEVARLLETHIAVIPLHRLTPVAALFFHGPHFGDRYGIADTLVKALKRENVSLAALSCTVSSISVIIKQEDLPAAVQVLTETFEDQSQGMQAAR